MRRGGGQERGFSLVEVAVAGALAAVMSVCLALVMRAGTRINKVNGDQMSISLGLRQGVHSMAWDLARTRSDQLWHPGVGGGLGPAWLPADLGAYPSVLFRLPLDLDGNGTVLNAAGNIEWSPNFFTFELGGLNGRELQRVETTPAGVEVSRLGQAYGVTAMTFRRWAAADPSVLEISMTVQRGAAVAGAPTSGEAFPVTLATRVRMRN